MSRPTEGACGRVGPDPENGVSRTVKRRSRSGPVAGNSADRMTKESRTEEKNLRGRSAERGGVQGRSRPFAPCFRARPEDGTWGDGHGAISVLLLRVSPRTLSPGSAEAEDSCKGTHLDPVRRKPSRGFGRRPLSSKEQSDRYCASIVPSVLGGLICRPSRTLRKSPEEDSEESARLRTGSAPRLRLWEEPGTVRRDRPAALQRIMVSRIAFSV